MSKMDNISIITKLIEWTAALSFRADTEKVIPNFDAIELVCLSLELPEKDRIEVRRRISEWKMKIHCDKNSLYEIVNNLHEGVLELGYFNLEDEANIEFYFSQYCVRNKHFKEAKPLLDQLYSKLEASSFDKSSEWFKQFISLIKKLLAEIKEQAGEDI